MTNIYTDQSSTFRQHNMHAGELWSPKRYCILLPSAVRPIVVTYGFRVSASVYSCHTSQGTCSKWCLLQLHGCCLQICGASRVRDLDMSIAMEGLLQLPKLNCKPFAPINATSTCVLAVQGFGSAVVKG